MKCDDLGDDLVGGCGGSKLLLFSLLKAFTAAATAVLLPNDKSMEDVEGGAVAEATT